MSPKEPSTNSPKKARTLITPVSSPTGSDSRPRILVGLQHGASLAGVATDTLNASLQKMNVNLAKAAQGEKVGEVFKAMGLDAKKLIDIDPMTALGQIADGLSGYSTQAEKAKAATEIFG